MEKNQLIKYHGTIYRVLAVEDDSILLIDCMERKMPKWYGTGDIDGYEDCTEEELQQTTGIVLTEERDLKPKARCAVRERYTVVAGILPFIAYDRLRTEAIKKIAEEKEICTQTVRNYLCQYLSFQSISALVPQERGRADRELTEDEKNCRWALNKFYFTRHKNSLKTAYTYIDVTGQRFNIGDINYIVTEKITDGEYRVECETAGKIGNQFLGEMIPMEYIKGLQTAELIEVLIPGEDEEDTEDLRQRYFDSFKESAFGGNRADYIKKTNDIPGVGRTKVTRVWNADISPADMIPKESVETWYNENQDTLSKEVKQWLDLVYYAAKEKKLTTGGTVLLTIINSEFGPASNTLVQAVQEIIDPEINAGEGYGLAPIGHVVKVESAKAKEIFVKTNLIFEPGYGWGNLQSSLKEAVSEYLLKLRNC